MLLVVGDLAVCFIAMILGGYLPLFFTQYFFQQPDPVRVKAQRGRRRPF